ncbi:MAG TPA: inositol monophosphatase family protein [Planctomycetota bacterium]|nr:inositol monophosphatase family protein [Planctomycetota bacterium]
MGTSPTDSPGDPGAAGAAGDPALAALQAVAAAHLRHVAHELVLPSFGGPLGEHSWVSHTQVHTAADVTAGQALHDLFAASFPGHGLVIEDRPTVAGDGVHEWFIDPIDGSANHLRGIPYVSLTAGLLRDGVPVVGVVHDLLRDTTLAAHRGGGAWLTDARGRRSRLSVSAMSRLDDAMLIAHLSRRGPLLCVPGALQHVLWNVRKIRCMGSIALDLALLAAGEADLLVVGRGSPQRMLDILGGLVVLEEAGGKVCTAAGEPVSASTRMLVAGVPALVDKFVALMRDHDLEGWRGEQAVRPPRDPGQA